MIAPSFPDEENKFYGGIFVKEQVRALSKHVDEINVVSPIPYSFGKEYKDRVCKDYSFDNVNVCFPRFWHLPLNYFRRMRGEREAKVIDKLIQKKGIKFDLIHAHFTWPSGYASVLLKKKYGVPLVVTGHGYDVYDLPFRGKEWFEKVKRTLESADHVITVSKSNFKTIVKKIGIPENSISVIPNGYDSNLFKPMDKLISRKKLNLPHDRTIILNVANLVPIKGHRYLIEAIKVVANNRDDILLVIVGDGILKKDLEKLIEKQKLNDHIQLVGAKPHQEIPLWMNACDIFVLPSLSEGTPTVMFEALGCGKPFIGTKVGGIPEIITSEKYGLIVEPASSEDLAEKILSALNMDWNAAEILQYAKQFTWGSIAKQIVNVYNETLNKYDKNSI